MIAGIDFVEAGERKLRVVDGKRKVWRQRAEFPHRGGEGAGRLEPVKQRQDESLNSLGLTENHQF